MGFVGCNGEKLKSVYIKVKVPLSPPILLKTPCKSSICKGFVIYYIRKYIHYSRQQDSPIITVNARILAFRALLGIYGNGETPLSCCKGNHLFCDTIQKRHLFFICMCLCMD